MSSKSTTKDSTSLSVARPEKPYPDFPLYAHPLGYWAKKIKGKLHYFGRWGRTVKGVMVRVEGDGWADAEVAYNLQYPDILKGRKPRKTSDDPLTVMDLCNRFLTSKQRKVETGRLSPRSLEEYRRTTDRLVRVFNKNRPVEDLGADDFEDMLADISEKCGVVRVGNEITRIKSVFRYAYENRLIPEAVNYGSEFVKPSSSELRRHKASSTKKLFTPAEIHALLKEADPVLQAAILLGVNTGVGNTDVSNLEFRHLDLKKGWIDFPRVKTGIERRSPLWPETIAALQVVIKGRKRPKHREDNEVVLLSVRGERLVRVTEKSRTDGITTGFSKLLKKLDINGRRGLGFYSLRHTFATIGLQVGDRDTVKAMMGHAESDILSLYDEAGPSDERRLAVSNHIRNWLFTQEKKSAKKGGAK
jgi:integrase